MRWLIWFLAIFLLLVLTNGIFGNIGFLPVVPLVGLVFTAIILARENVEASIFTAVVVGVMMDFISGLPDGIMLLSLLISSVFVYMLVYWWLAHEYNVAVLVSSVALMTLLFCVLTIGLARLFVVFGFNLQLAYGYQLLAKTPWHIGLNLLLAYPVFLYYLLTKQLIKKTNKS